MMFGFILLSVATVFGLYFTATAVAIKTFSRKKLSDHFERHHRNVVYDRFIDNIHCILILCGAMRCLASIGIYIAIDYLLTGYEISQRVGVIAFFAASVAIVFTVAIPIPIARYNSDKLLIKSLSVLNLSVSFLKPLLKLLLFFDLLVKRISNHTPSDRDDAADRILYIVHEHEEEGYVDKEQKQMIQAVFDLKETTADQIMTPRTEVLGLEIDATLEDIKAFIESQGHSRIPVYQDNLDHIIGILYAKDLIKFLASDQSFNIKDNLREVVVVPESKIITDLLREFKANKVHIAMVLDEYGGTAGLITIEDILEELVGEIEDEFETPEAGPAIQSVSENIYQVDARVYIDDLNDQLHLNLPEEEDYDTVGGFVFSTLGHIPDRGESFDYKDIVITVVAAEPTKVQRVHIKLPGHHLNPEVSH